jgi:DNA (cytosine-5)-methyltransferase 1
LSAAKTKKRSRIGVIDIFAGPGGLGEGFSGFESAQNNGDYPFELAVSAEMEASAHATLRLRAFYRLLQRREGMIPAAYWEFLREKASGTPITPQEKFGKGPWRWLWSEADEEALNLTLGQATHNLALVDRIKAVQSQFDEMVLIGGPPCQAYSVVGRARQTRVAEFQSKGDPRHFLYKQYLEILARFKPAVFIMENVKGILTSKVGNQEMFSAIRRDLSNPNIALGRQKTGSITDRYALLPIHVPEGSERTEDLVANDPGGFVIRCENHGVPQARHRVIIMGVRLDYAKPRVARIPGLEVPQMQMRIEQALAGLPSLRSGLSREPDDPHRWYVAMEEERRKVIGATKHRMPDVARILEATVPAADLPRSSIKYAPGRVTALASQLRGENEGVVLNHETRGHMKSDLGRYMFCAAYSVAEGRSPTSRDFPAKLAPEHQNWESGAFADRFRVQFRGEPSSTITSHLSKDGHAFIHWDPAQCRSLTVREAARLQTFPDDYLFLGNKTEQFVQVGNAVPPFLAKQIAKIVYRVLYE